MKSVQNRVFHHQDILCTTEEPVCVHCSAEMVWVGLVNGFVQCFSTHTSKKKFHKLYEFQIKWRHVKSIKYLRNVQKLVLLETKAGNTKKCARVYCLIHQDNSKTMIKSYKLPFSNDVKSIVVEEESNLVVVYSKRVIYVWKFFTYQMFPLLLMRVIAHNWEQIRVVSVSQEYLGYGSKCDVRILKIVYKEKDEIEEKKENKQGLYVFHGNSNIKSSSVTEIRFESENNHLIPSPVFNNVEGYNKNFEYIGEIDVVDHSVFVRKDFIKNVKSVLYKHFSEDVFPSSIHFYRKAFPISESNFSNDGVWCVISTRYKGFVYNISKPKLECKFEFNGKCLMTAFNSLFLFAITPAGLEVRSVLGSSDGCLLRTYHFFGVKYISTTNNHIVLLTKNPENSKNVSVKVVEKGNSSPSFVKHVLLTKEPNTPQKNSEELGGRKKSFTNLKSFSTKSFSSVVNVFSKLKEGTKEKKKVKFTYNIMILRLVEFFEFYEDLFRSANTYNLEKKLFLSLVQESHSLLQSYYYFLLREKSKKSSVISRISTEMNFKNCEKLLKNSYGFLGDVYCDNKMYQEAAVSYVSSTRTVEEIWKRLKTKPQHFLHFLSKILFNNEIDQSRIVHTEKMGNLILQDIYFQHQRDQLSTVILESWLHVYDKKKAIKLLQITPTGKSEKPPLLPKKKEFKFNAGFIPKDSFVLGLLHLDLVIEDPEYLKRSVGYFKMIEPSNLVELCIENSNLFSVDVNLESSQIKEKTTNVNYYNLKVYKSSPTIGTVLRVFFPWTLLEIMIKLNQKPFSIKQSVLILRNVSDEHTDLLLQHYFCSLINLKIPCNSMDLIELYVNFLKKNPQKIKKVHLNELSYCEFNFEKYRHSWLVENEKEKKLAHIWEAFENPKKYTLINFEGLLCLNPNKSIDYEKVLSLLKTINVDDLQNEINNLKLLCGSFLGEFKECFEILINNSQKRKIFFKFAHFYFKKGNILQWKLLIDVLINYLRAQNQPITQKTKKVSEKYWCKFCKNYAKEKKKNHYCVQSIFHRVLIYLAKSENASVKDFLSILPNDGNISYFLPYITQSFFKV